MPPTRKIKKQITMDQFDFKFNDLIRISSLGDFEEEEIRGNMKRALYNSPIWMPGQKGPISSLLPDTLKIFERDIENAVAKFDYNYV
jgi:hypothetical protein